MKNMVWKTHNIGNINRQKWYFVAFCNLKLTVIFSLFLITQTMYNIYSVATHLKKNRSA